MRRILTPKIAIPASLLIATLVLGVIGWADAYRNDLGYVPWGAVVYHTLLALTGDGTYLFEAPHDDESAIARGNVWLMFARYVGIATTVSTFFALAASYLAIWFSWFTASLRSGHTLVFGVSDFAVSWVRQDGQITCVDTPNALSTLDKASFPRRSLLLGTTVAGFGPSVWGAGKKPSKVVFGAKDALTNVNRARAWADRVRSEGGQIVLRIEQKAVARDIELLAPELSHARLISRSDTIARSLVTHIAPTELAHLRGQERVHVLLVGMGSVNLALAEEIIMRCHRPGQKPPRVTVLDVDRDAALAKLHRERPDIMNPELAQSGIVLDVIGFDGLQCTTSTNSSVLQALEKNTPITAILVAAGDDTVSAGIAMRLRRLQVEANVMRAPIFVRSRTSSEIAPARFTDLTGGVVPFGGRLPTETDVALEHMHEALAKRLHDKWRASPDVERTDANLWQNLSGHKRRSSYRAAFASNEVLFNAGLVPPPDARLAGLRAEPSAINAVLGDKALVRRLAGTEHDRWNAERRLEGFRHAAAGKTDQIRKRHALLVPFNELPGDQARKDVRNVQEALHGALERHQNDPKAPCWRRVLRVGLLGPLDATASWSETVVQNAIEELMRRYPDFGVEHLEIVTPNAPGFDRWAAVAMATAWHRITARPARLVFVQAVSTAALDQLALETARTPMAHDEMAAQSAALNALFSKEIATDCHILVRELGMSDGDVLADPALRKSSLTIAQDEVLRLCDELIADTKAGAAKWTQAAVDAWSGEHPPIVPTTSEK